MKKIKQYFGSLKQEYEKSIVASILKVSESIEELHMTILQMTGKLEEDIKLLLSYKDNPILLAEYLSKIIKGSYISTSDEFQELWFNRSTILLFKARSISNETLFFFCAILFSYSTNCLIFSWISSRLDSLQR